MKQPPILQQSTLSGTGSALTGIEAVVFDAVGTLIFPQPSVAEAYSSAIRRHCGIEVDERDVRAEVRVALGTRSQGDALRTNEDTERQFWANLIRQLCPTSGGFQQCFDDLFAHFEDPANWRCFADVGEVVSELKAAGLPLAIASNFDSRLNTVCDGLPEISEISERVISSEVGWKKPSPRFFEALSGRLKIPAERILFVGDDFHNDVSGALGGGMRAAWICRGERPPPPENGERPTMVLNSLSRLPTLVLGLPEVRRRAAE